MVDVIKLAPSGKFEHNICWREGHFWRGANGRDEHECWRSREELVGGFLIDHRFSVEAEATVLLLLFFFVFSTLYKGILWLLAWWLWGHEEPLWLWTCLGLALLVIFENRLAYFTSELSIGTTPVVPPKVATSLWMFMSCEQQWLCLI